MAPNFSSYAASSDGVIDCSCCGKGVLEIKCSYSHRESFLYTAAAEDPKFCLKESDGSLSLDCTHSYYYQIQTQMFVMWNTQISVYVHLQMINSCFQQLEVEVLYIVKVLICYRVKLPQALNRWPLE